MDHRTIIKELGGPSQLAALAGITESAVRAWNNNGIPYKFFPMIKRLAKDQGLQITDDALLEYKSSAARNGQRAA
jgi:hypothetical protein